MPTIIPNPPDTNSGYLKVKIINTSDTYGVYYSGGVTNGQTFVNISDPLPPSAYDILTLVCPTVGQNAEIQAYGRFTYDVNSNTSLWYTWNVL